jgi:hypothetical protein
MSMIYGLRQASEETISALKRNPQLILSYLGQVEPDPPATKASLWQRLFGSRAIEDEPEPIGETLNTDEGAEEIDLDKSWHALHFLYSGFEWEGDPPAAFLLNWGESVGDVDVGYGPARVFRTHEVQDIRLFLDQIDETQLRQLYNPKEMSRLKIYPDIWRREPPDDDPLGYAIEYHQILTQFIQRTSDKSLGLVVYLS